jgi:hypothetical protein
MIIRGQDLLKKNLQGHRIPKKKNYTGTYIFLVTDALRDYTRMVSDLSLLLSEPENGFPIHTLRIST